MSAPIRSKSLKGAQPVSLLDALPELSNEGKENIKAMMSYKGSDAGGGRIVR